LFVNLVQFRQDFAPAPLLFFAFIYLFSYKFYLLNSFIFPLSLLINDYWEVIGVTKKGAKYKCNECGLVVVVDEACGCSPCDLICCGVPMKEVKPKAKK
jgi:hypothetical protein